MSRSLIVDVRISAAELQRYYQGSARNIIAMSRQGKRVQFPANILRPFVTHDGINGTFQLTFDASNRFEKIEQLAVF